MTPKERAAMEQALGALVRAEAMYGQPNADIQTALREALAEHDVAEEVKTTSEMNSFEHQEFLYKQSQDFKRSQGGNGW
jgi:hypothetical protein